MEKAIAVNGILHGANAITGELITREKYRFIDGMVIRSIIDDVFDIIMEDKNKTEWTDGNYQQQESRVNARIQVANEEVETRRIASLKAEVNKCWNMVAYGNAKAESCSRQKDQKRALAWKTWAYHKELEAEYLESQI